MLGINVLGEIYFGMRACVIGFGNSFAAYYRGVQILVSISTTSYNLVTYILIPEVYSKSRGKWKFVLMVI